MGNHVAPSQTPNKWISDPLVRKFIYGLVATLIPVLVGLGYISPDQVQAVLDIAAAVLGLGTTGLAIANTPKN